MSATTTKLKQQTTQINILTQKQTMTKTIKNDYVHFLNRIIIQQAYFLWNETQSWNTTFNRLNILVEYLYDILYFREDIILSPNDLEEFHNHITECEEIYPYQSFDDFVITLTKMSDQTLDYENVLYNLDDPTYKSNLYRKYQKHSELTGLKNWIINEVLYQEKDTYIDSIPYLEYTASPLSPMKFRSIELEKRAREIIDHTIKM